MNINDYKGSVGVQAIYACHAGADHGWQYQLCRNVRIWTHQVIPACG